MRRSQFGICWLCLNHFWVLREIWEKRYGNQNAKCPVCQWTAIVIKTLGYLGANKDTALPAIWRHERIGHITLNTKRHYQRASRNSKVIHKEKLGINRTATIRIWLDQAHWLQCTFRSNAQFMWSWWSINGHEMPCWGISESKSNNSHPTCQVECWDLSCIDMWQITSQQSQD